MGCPLVCACEYFLSHPGEKFDFFILLQERIYFEKLVDYPKTIFWIHRPEPRFSNLIKTEPKINYLRDMDLFIHSHEAARSVLWTIYHFLHCHTGIDCSFIFKTGQLTFSQVIIFQAHLMIFSCHKLIHKHIL